MNTVINKVENILTSEYTISNFIEFVQEVFSNIEFVAPDKFNKEYSNFSSHIEGSTHVGNYTDPEGNSIIIAAVQLKSRAYVENSRSVQRNYAKKLIENAASDAAFVAFFTEGESKWRISFVRLDYEMKFENGKMKASENLTPAKRYSYLVGRDEPCHTAIDRFKIFIEDNNSMPTLDQMEDVFSVEAVTNEFFKLYCEKFHQVREHLESNEDFVEEAKQHNFTAAQFTKKLMGQIVFLYFLQKKGWLGVNALPKTMTEKEYKNAFFARGAKSREILPVAYRQNPKDGLYYLMPKELATLNDEDETILAQCVKGQPWGTGPKNFMRKLFETSQKKGANFFDDYLEPLFYNALNVNRGEQGYDPILHCRIPFLSGGLFEPIDGYEWEYNDFGIPNELFSNRINNNPRTGDGILDIFDRYNFTMSEDEPLEREVAIDPEMLGKVFENLLDVNDRKSKGAFYTPREIVHYMCQESLINYLTKEINVSEDAVRDFILYGDFMKGEDTVKEKRQGNGNLYISEELYKLDNNGNVVTNKLTDMDKALAEVRVADPAVGSGAFPLGMLNEIVRARQNISAYYSITMNPNQTRLMYSMERSPYALKYQTIKNCIYAADIEPSAVDIAQLRLWLSLVIDDEINPNADPNNPLEGHRNPTPLPNLECNILCGNSLIDEFEGIKLINQDEILGTAAAGGQTNIWEDSFSNILPRLIDAQDRLFRCDDTNKKHEIMNEISAIKDMIILSQMEGVDSGIVERYKESKKLASKPYVLWQLDFARVFKEKGGFDIVIGNPPYGAKLSEKDKALYKALFSDVHMRTPDSFNYFISKSLRLIRRGGTESFIVPNNLLFQNEYEKTRKLLTKENTLIYVINLGDNVFENAQVPTCIYLTVKETCPDYSIKYADFRHTEAKVVNLGVFSDSVDISLLNSVPGYVFGVNAEKNELMQKIEKESLLVDEIVEELASGISTGGNKAFCPTATEVDAYNIEKEIIEPMLAGKDIDRYEITPEERYVIYLPKSVNAELYPNAISFISEYKDKLNKRSEVKKGVLPWWAMNRPRFRELFEGKKIVLRQTSDCIKAVIDTNNLYAIDSLLILRLKDKCGFSYEYTLAAINSSFNDYIYKNITQEAGRVFPQVKPINVRKLYIPKVDEEIQTVIEEIVIDILNGNIDKDIGQKKIDELFYQKLGLTQEQITIIEGN